MKEISIPLPDFIDKQIAEIEVKISSRKRQFNFKVESFRWEMDDEILTLDEKIKNLQYELKKYDKAWELIKYLGLKTIQNLFRQKEISNPN